MSDLSYLDRNVMYIKRHLMAHARQSFEYIVNTMTDELRGFAVLLTIPIWCAYNLVIKPSLMNTVKHALKHIIRVAHLLLLTDVEIASDPYNKILDQEFAVYLENDVTAKFCRKSHKNYARLVKNLWHIFDWQVRAMYYLMRVSDPVAKNYPELCQAIWTVDECTQILKNQLDLVNESMEIMAEDASILDMPIASNFVATTLLKAYQKKTVQIFQEIRDFYNGILPSYLR